MIFNISLSELEIYTYLEKFFRITQDTLRPIIIIIHLCVIISSGMEIFSKYKAIPKTCLPPAALNVWVKALVREKKYILYGKF